jgi:hypothetical protein
VFSAHKGGAAAIAPALASIGQPVDPRPERWARIADAVTREERGDVQHYSPGPGIQVANGADARPGPIIPPLR